MSKKLLALSMCAYVGTKSVLATTMTRGEYNEYRGWTIPENEDPSEQGYLVEYVDGGKPNDERHVGYISWSPRDVFEKSYHQSQTPQDRVQNEYYELTNNHEKLSALLEGHKPDFLDDLDWDLLKEQHNHMSAYRDTLIRRIAKFRGEPVAMSYSDDSDKKSEPDYSVGELPCTEGGRAFDGSGSKSSNYRDIDVLAHILSISGISSELRDTVENKMKKLIENIGA